jgi:hypothetical protein
VGRRNRKLYLLKTYPADVKGIRVTYDKPHYVYDTVAKRNVMGLKETWFPDPQNFVSVWNSQCRVMEQHGSVVQIEEVPCTRCYRCGGILTFETLTVDRIVPGCKKTARYPRGGTYVRENIRPACGGCNSDTGGPLHATKDKPVKLEVKVVRFVSPFRVEREVAEYAPPEWRDGEYVA